MNRIAVIGLGYVGYSLYRAFYNNGDTVYGIDFPSVTENLEGTNLGIDYSVIKDVDYIFICGQTPVNEWKKPDLTYLSNINEKIAPYLNENHIVIYESTLPPGYVKNYVYHELYHIGTKFSFSNIVVSPERISPNDKHMSLEDMTKIVACPSLETRRKVETLYKSIQVSVYGTSNWDVAIYSKLLENIQRDVNIALINEFTKFCIAGGVDVHEVLEAARTKENFMYFHKGIVGGHCIPVDTYYLLNENRFGTNLTDGLIRKAREVNEKFMDDIGVDIIRLFRNMKHICIIGVGYKGNSTDTRNSGAFSIYKYLIQNLPEGHYVSLYDDKIEPYTTTDYKSADCYVLTNMNNFAYDNIDELLKKPVYDITGLYRGKMAKCLYTNLNYNGYGFIRKQINNN